MGKTTALLLVFVGLKLGGHLDWSWWWVLSSYWIAIAFGVTASLRRRRRSWTSVHAQSWLALRASDGLFLLFFVLERTDSVSWSWFWILSPLWICKPIGLLISNSMSSKAMRLWRRISEDRFAWIAALAGLSLAVLRLDGLIPSWWWVASGIPLPLIFISIRATRRSVAAGRGSEKDPEESIDKVLEGMKSDYAQQRKVYQEFFDSFSKTEDAWRQLVSPEAYERLKGARDEFRRQPKTL